MIVKNVEKKENNTAMLQGEIDAESFDKAINGAYKKLKGRINVPGFRKGKAPRMVIEGMFGADVFYEDAMESLAPEAFEYAVGEEKLDTVGMPSIVDFNVDDAKVLTITFSTELYPEVTLGQYKGLEGVYAEAEVTDEEVEAALADARKRNARFVDVDRPVQQGDSIVLDFEGFVDGVAFEGGKADNYTLEIGSGAFIPGFEDQLVGLAAGQEGEVKVTFPEQYAENLAGKDAVFKVKVHTVREPELPELDDEFAKDVSEFDTLEEYKADLRKNLAESRKTEAERSFKSEIMNQALDNMTAEVPESMIAEKTNEFLDNYADSMGLRGRVSREELIKGMGMGEEEFNSMMRPGALRQVQADLLLDAVVKAEGLEATEEEKADFYKKLEEDYGENSEQIKAMIDEKLMARDIERRKAADLIYSSAVKTAPKAEEAPVEENKD